MGNQKCKKRTNKYSDPLNRGAARKRGQHVAFNKCKADVNRSRTELVHMMIAIRSGWDPKATQKSILAEIDQSVIGRNVPSRSKKNTLQEVKDYWRRHVANYRGMVNARVDLRGDVSDFSGGHSVPDQGGCSEGDENEAMPQGGATLVADQGQFSGGAGNEAMP